ncbi:MAG TPA: amino acid ABC transporter permease [Ktedonobacterales bacterium]|nr:amino acid ABC transporter permease [Ktedonobacterales bacterium]
MPSFFAPLIEALPSLLAGAWVTIYASIFGIILAMVFAIPAGLGRLSKNVIIRSICSFYVETIRGTPLLLQLIVWYFGVRILLLTLFNFNVDVATYNLLTTLNSNSLYPAAGVSGLFFAIFGLSFNYGAYLAEVIRAGVLAVEPGQTEAAESLGLSRFQTTRLIVLPQALRIMIPSLTNNFITLIQDTSFFQIVAVFELSLTTFGHVQEVSNPGIRWEFFGFELIVYFVICYSLALVAQRMERRNGAAPGRRGLFPFMFLPPRFRPRRPPAVVEQA